MMIRTCLRDGLCVRVCVCVCVCECVREIISDGLKQDGSGEMMSDGAGREVGSMGEPSFFLPVVIQGLVKSWSSLDLTEILGSLMIFTSGGKRETWGAMEIHMKVFGT